VVKIPDRQPLEGSPTSQPDQIYQADELQPGPRMQRLRPNGENDGPILGRNACYHSRLRLVVR